MPTEGEEALVRRESLPQVDLLVAGHHGSKYASGEVLLRTVTPKTALISVGEGNSYGHPTQETLDRLSDIGAELYRTDLQSTVTIQVNDTETKNEDTR
jgi:competence protein ComEC